MVVRTTEGKSILVLALALALTANIAAIGMNGIRGQRTCIELEALKAPEYKLAQENLKNIILYKTDLIRLFGSDPTLDTYDGMTKPRWRIEYERSIRVSTERVERFKPHSCPFLFWGDD